MVAWEDQISIARSKDLNADVGAEVAGGVDDRQLKQL